MPFHPLWVAQDFFKTTILESSQFPGNHFLRFDQRWTTWNPARRVRIQNTFLSEQGRRICFRKSCENELCKFLNDWKCTNVEKALQVVIKHLREWYELISVLIIHWGGKYIANTRPPKLPDFESVPSSGKPFGYEFQKSAPKDYAFFSCFEMVH